MSLQQLVVVTGMSGSGKGTVLKAFEDLGFFCIDNLPVPLIPKFIESIHVSGGVVERAALVIDIRAGERLHDLETMLSSLRGFEFRLFVLYLEARDEVLVRRFSETRRPHPLATEKPIREAIRLERKRLRTIREFADVIIDTSEYSIHEVKALVMDRFREHPRAERLMVYLVSFGYQERSSIGIGPVVRCALPAESLLCSRSAHAERPASGCQPSTCAPFRRRRSLSPGCVTF